MIMRYGKKFYRKYKNYILFNKNIIMAGTAALIVGTFFTQSAEGHKDGLWTTVLSAAVLLI